MPQSLEASGSLGGCSRSSNCPQYPYPSVVLPLEEGVARFQLAHHPGSRVGASSRPLLNHFGVCTRLIHDWETWSSGHFRKQPQKWKTGSPVSLIVQECFPTQTFLISSCGEIEINFT